MALSGLPTVMPLASMASSLGALHFNNPLTFLGMQCDALRAVSASLHPRYHLNVTLTNVKHSVENFRLVYDFGRLKLMPSKNPKSKF